MKILAILMWSVMVCGAQLVPSNTPPSVTLAWDASPSTNIVHYNIYVGYNSGQYVDRLNTGNTNQFTIADLIAGKSYFFAATAVDSSGQESVFSNEVSYTAPGRPTPPILRITTKPYKLPVAY